MESNQKGFSLIELLIVVVVVAVIAAVAIPNLLAARRAANEGAAISSIRTLHGGQMLYQTSFGSGRFAGTNSNTGDTAGIAALATAGLVDPVLGTGSKSGFNFVGAVAAPTATTAATFFFSANPVTVSGVTRTGTKRYCVTSIGPIAVDSNNLATAFDYTSALAATAMNN